MMMRCHYCTRELPLSLMSTRFAWPVSHVCMHVGGDGVRNTVRATYYPGAERDMLVLQQTILDDDTRWLLPYDFHDDIAIATAYTMRPSPHVRALMYCEGIIPYRQQFKPLVHIDHDPGDAC